MNSIDYIGFDIHKKTISFCVKAQDGQILDEGVIPARRADLSAWVKMRLRPWVGAMEATLFTGWIYDHLKPLAQELKVAHPPMLRAIAANASSRRSSLVSGLCDGGSPPDAPENAVSRPAGYPNSIFREGLRERKPDTRK